MTNPHDIKQSILDAWELSLLALGAKPKDIENAREKFWSMLEDLEESIANYEEQP